MSDLLTRLCVDVCSAGISAAAISPVIFVIDKSIMEATSGKANSIKASIKASTTSFLTKPRAFLSSVPFLLLYSVYTATYCTANIVDTVSHIDAKDAQSWARQTTGYGKFLATTTVNLSACVYKDMRYAKFYGVGAPRKMPLASLMLFSARDSLTVFASFNIPVLLAPMLGLNVAQILTPCAMQFISTPLHLLGLDIYNRTGQTMQNRLVTVRAGYWRSSFARICRILPAFGVGGVLNRNLREAGMVRASAVPSLS
ncbi:Uncharacterized membrane protein C365.16 [Taphrina deformans PYCC 5710]|uniref:Uncharacterized membrane protein C365.16 n=1 Tax=Taphrina deformans (strain PYCC 5710 / ATCC 11124 / CBS 356.35 / IMI 108563 / JCM 9778 / NBRC 8474) TaxID=1097556 RepID=R4X6V7_TAPDE|nr:Uncharacterized membrane protein C365.16 [Taphrina deformans PYCC 5710]|eukprot:CCG80952.1 Uncharacterized membrane protein C365.16 [Taphrina deformans PYCC 5710]